MSNTETPKTASDLRVSASVCVVGVLAEALAPHAFPTFDIERGCWDCPCGEPVPRSSNGWEKHVASVVAALPNIAIVELPGYSEQVADTRPGFEGLTFPAWYPEGLGDIGAAVGQHPGIVEARWSGMSMWTPAEAESVAAALLAAARAAGGQA